MAARKARKAQAKAESSEDEAFEALLDYLKRNRGFDFTGYKRSTLMRRVSKRMHEVGIDRFVAYQDFLEVDPDEFGFLFNTILINITGFFRDTAGVGVPRCRGGAGDPRSEEARPADPALERGLRLRRGGLLARDGLRRGDGRGRLPLARQDLRHRHRRRGARRRAPRRVLGARHGGGARRAARQVLHARAATRSRSAPDCAAR